MDRLLKHRPTGRTRHQPRTIRTGWFKTKTVLIHQTEMIGYVPEFSVGMVTGHTTEYWVDTKPEDLIVDEGRTEFIRHKHLTQCKKG